MTVEGLNTGEQDAGRQVAERQTESENGTTQAQRQLRQNQPSRSQSQPQPHPHPHPQRHMPWRLALLVCAGVTLLTGLDAALLRVGLAAPVTGVGLADAHGPLMIYGFLGTVIALERAVALRSVVRHSWWGYIAPVAGALG
ncbi:MAG: hypothetical protein LKI60_01830, partial [Bifidobacterium tibiigranuli]|nr:hypothetical protein [Bifidobacterium tibiigranuli]